MNPDDLYEEQQNLDPPWPTSDQSIPAFGCSSVERREWAFVHCMLEHRPWSDPKTRETFNG